MYKWKVVFTLMNGTEVEGLYEGPENNTRDVAKKLIGNVSEISFVGINDVTKKHNVLIKAGEILTLDISEYDQSSRE